MVYIKKYICKKQKEFKGTPAVLYSGLKNFKL